MQKWQVTFVDDHGEQVDECFESASKPTMEEAAQWIRAKFMPVADKLDLNDLEGRAADPTVKSLKSQNSIEILGIKPSA